jgi:hypothetical protein
VDQPQGFEVAGLLCGASSRARRAGPDGEAEEGDAGENAERVGPMPTLGASVRSSVRSPLCNSHEMLSTL